MEARKDPNADICPSRDETNISSVKIDSPPKKVYQLFFDTTGEHRLATGPRDMIGSRMYRDGDEVYHEYFSYDSEDFRSYNLSIRLSLEVYKSMLDELTASGKAELEINETSLTLNLDGENVHLSISGCAGNDPGGRRVYTTGPSNCKLEDLLIK